MARGCSSGRGTTRRSGSRAATRDWPDPGRNPRWRVTALGRGFSATLQRGQATIAIHLPSWQVRRCRIEITGDWPDRDLVVLSAVFALLIRRRRFLIIVSGGSH